MDNKEYIKNLVNKMIEQQKERNYTWIPSSLAFYFFISFIPFLFAIIFLSIRFINIDINLIINFIDIKEITPVLEQFIEYVKEISEPSIILVIIFLIYSIYVSSKGISAVIYSINAFFGFTIPNIIKTNIIAFFTIIVIIIAIFAMLILASVIPTIIRLFPIDFDFTFVFLAAIPFLYFIIHIIYMIVTDFRLKFRHIYKGALLTTLAIVILIFFSNIIFRVGATSSIIYGSLVIIVLIGHFFLYIGFSIYFGISLNVASYKLEQEEIENRKYLEFKKRFKGIADIEDHYD